MTAQRGSKLLIKVGDGAASEVFTTLGFLRSKSVEVNGNPIDVTTDGDVDVNSIVWRSSMYGVMSLSISGSGISKAIGQAQALHRDMIANTIRNLQVVVPYIGMYQGPFIVSPFTFTGEYDGVVQFDLGLELNGAPTFTPETAPGGGT